ncbi:MAG: hypothetical protein CMF12_13955 [Idiomarina sp.]|uniref:hypothetical protein n=1 Tax=Idiomarina sp. TaxID=1874361 RepID=UPI000C361F03|nr:hypothetical protein [Idiomarina sp.]MBT43610.1 hypothetical protein [Idiomarina sp.]
MAKKHWAIDMAAKAIGQIRHFRTVGDRRKKQSKIFFGTNKVFVVEFENWEHVGTREIIRAPNDSLLAIESEIEQRYKEEGAI